MYLYIALSARKIAHIVRVGITTCDFPSNLNQAVLYLLYFA